MRDWIEHIIMFVCGMLMSFVFYAFGLRGYALLAATGIVMLMAGFFYWLGMQYADRLNKEAKK